MPSSMTHTYFGKDVIKQIPINCKEKIDEKKEHFYLFCQGSDPFMFYHFLLGKTAKQSMNIQSTIHKTKTRDFFINTINLINKKNLINNQEIMAYLYGNICHYYLDSYTHPFIYYNSGVFDRNNKSTYKYNGKHQEIEYNIDLYNISKRESTLPYKFKIHKNIFNVNTFSTELKHFINELMKKTYNYNNISNHYIKCVHYMKYFFRLVNYDPTGIKLTIYKVIDKISPITAIKLEKLSYHHNYQKDLSYLNLEHKEWSLPWDKNKTSSSSFFDLYNNAIKDCTNTIKEVTNMLETKKIDNQKLNQIFKNNSYATGEDCNKKVTMKYFRY